MRAGSRLNSIGPNPRYPKTSAEVAMAMATGMPTTRRPKKATTIPIASHSLGDTCAALFVLRPSQEGETVAQRVRHALDGEQRKADRDQRLEREAVGHSTGIGRALADAPGLLDKRQGQLHHYDGEDDRKKAGHDLDHMAQSERHLVIEEVDPDLLALEQRVGHPDERDQRDQVPFQLLQPDRASAEEVAGKDVAGYDQDDRHRRIGGEAAENVDGRLDSPDQPIRDHHSQYTGVAVVGFRQT